MDRQGTIFIEGFLIKKGHVRHNWKIRWFKLSDTSLRYYTDKKHSVPHGRIALNNASLIKNTQASFQDRENVFIVTTSSGVQYPIQASTATEYKIWTDAIQKVIDSTKFANSSTDNCSVPQQSGIITSGLKTDEQRKADLFSTMGKLSHGTQAHSQMIDGILYDQVLSGLELRRWCEVTMGIGREEAEDAIKSLVQIGVIESLTTASLDFTLYDNTHYFRLLSDESSVQSMTSSYLNNFKSTSTNLASSGPTNKKASPHGPGLPSDLPPGDIVKRGILFKRGHIVPSWKARCFVLQKFPATLSYFDPSKKSLKTINSLTLHGASVFAVAKSVAESALKVTNPPDHLFCVKTGAGALYLIIAASEEEKSEWIDAISTMCGKRKEV